MNKCEFDILNKSLQNEERKYYSLDNMDACLHIGNIRKNQEDACLITQKLYDDSICLLSVADGMGGLKNGSLASYIAVKELLLWFKYLDENIIYKENNIFDEIKIFVNYVDDLIRKNCGEGGSTLSFALILKENTYFLNVGDSRIYYLKNDNLIQISCDHSITYNYYLNGIIKNKEDIKFHKKNHLITSKIGGSKKNVLIDFNILKNNEYDKIFIFSDGVTDCLSDEQIKLVIKNSHNNYSSNIIDTVLNTNSYKNFNNDDYYDNILGGKDNTTSCCYFKKGR